MKIGRNIREKGLKAGFMIMSLLVLTISLILYADKSDERFLVIEEDTTTTLVEKEVDLSPDHKLGYDTLLDLIIHSVEHQMALGDELIQSFYSLKTVKMGLYVFHCCLKVDVS